MSTSRSPRTLIFAAAALEPIGRRTRKTVSRRRPVRRAPNRVLHRDAEGRVAQARPWYERRQRLDPLDGDGRSPPSGPARRMLRARADGSAPERVHRLRPSTIRATGRWTGVPRAFVEPRRCSRTSTRPWTEVAPSPYDLALVVLFGQLVSTARPSSSARNRGTGTSGTRVIRARWEGGADAGTHPPDSADGSELRHRLNEPDRMQRFAEVVRGRVSPKSSFTRMLRKDLRSARPRGRTVEHRVRRRRHGRACRPRLGPGLNVSLNRRAAVSVDPRQTSGKVDRELFRKRRNECLSKTLICLSTDGAASWTTGVRWQRCMDYYSRRDGLQKREHRSVFELLYASGFPASSSMLC